MVEEQAQKERNKLGTEAVLNHIGEIWRHGSILEALEVLSNRGIRPRVPPDSLQGTRAASSRSMTKWVSLSADSDHLVFSHLREPKVRQANMHSP